MLFAPLKSGISVEGGEISSYKSEIKAPSYFYLMAGVHGDEVEGVYVLNQLFEYLKQDNELDLPIIVIPILNIDGYRHATRVNARAVDLNRNYPTSNWSPDYKESQYNPGAGPLSEPENQYLAKLFDKFPPKFILSFHSWKPILNYNGNCKNIANFLHQYNNYPVEGDIGYPTPGSLGYWGQEKFNAPVLTFECPRLETGKSLKEIWDENKQGLIDLLKTGPLKDMKC